MVFLKKILVTTDLSMFSLAAVEHAATFGLLYAARMYLMYVADADSRKSHGNAEEEARKALAEFAAKNINPEIRFHQIVRAGSPAEMISRFAGEESIDLVVMATHGRTGIRHAMVGSTVEKVVRLCPAAVLTVKPRPVRELILRNDDIESELHLR